MSWAGRGRYTDAYSIAPANGGPAIYVPGAKMYVTLKVERLSWQYRGLIVDAVDAANTTVGSFGEPPTPPPHPSPGRHDSPNPAKDTSCISKS